MSSQESLDASLCSTGSLGSLGSLGEPVEGADTPSVSDGGSMHTVTSLESTAAAARPIRGYAVIEVGLQQRDASARTRRHLALITSRFALGLKWKRSARVSSTAAT